MSRKKANKLSILNKPLLARVTVPIFAVIVVGLGYWIIKMPPLVKQQPPSMPQPVVSLYLEEPPGDATENAAYYYQKAYIKLLDIFKSDKTGMTDAELLKLAQPVFDLFEKGTRMRACDFTFGGQMKNFKANTFRRALSRVFLSQVIFLKAEYLFGTGHADEALDLYRMFCVYLTQLSSQKNTLSEIELINNKELMFEKLKALIESGSLTLDQTRALLLILEVEERHEVPFSTTMLKAADEAKKAVTVAPREIFTRYERISDEYFAFLTAALDRLEADKLPGLASKRGDLLSYGEDTLKMSRQVIAKSDIDRDLVAKYLAGKRASRMYDEMARAIFTLTCPASDVLFGDYFLAAGEWQMLKTALAARLFKEATGVWPLAAADLAPRFLTAVPKDPYSEGSFTFSRADDGALKVTSARAGLEMTVR